jgi:hypothetical protein
MQQLPLPDVSTQIHFLITLHLFLSNFSLLTTESWYNQTFAAI